MTGNAITRDRGNAKKQPEFLTQASRYRVTQLPRYRNWEVAL